jgi:AcrR family transcriptional regulator
MIYHLFPTIEAAYTGLVHRYNARMDRELDALFDGPFPDVWQDIARTLLTAARFAAELGRRFHAPYVPALEQRLAIAMAINDRVWSLGLDDDATISDFLFDESVRAVLGYLGHFLPPCLAPKPATGG